MCEQAVFQTFLTLVPEMKRDIESMVRTRSTQNLRSLKVRERVLRAAVLLWVLECGCSPSSFPQLPFLECLSEAQLDMLVTASTLVSVPSGTPRLGCVCMCGPGVHGYMLSLVQAVLCSAKATKGTGFTSFCMERCRWPSCLQV